MPDHVKLDGSDSPLGAPRFDDGISSGLWPSLIEATIKASMPRLVENITKSNAFLQRLSEHQAKMPPPTRWQRLRWWLHRRRRRLGEIVAGRTFDDDYD